MAAITICSDFGAPKNKVWHCFHCFPIYFPWSDGTGCHDLHGVTKNQTRLKLLSPRMEEPLQYNDSQVSGSPLREVWDFMIAEVLPAYLSYCGFFFMSFSYRRSFLVGPSIFWSTHLLQIVVTFDVLMREGELRVLILHHLGCSLLLGFFFSIIPVFSLII